MKGRMWSLSKVASPIIHCYNTEYHIVRVVTKTRQYVDEFIVVNDGSKSKTKMESLIRQESKSFESILEELQ